MQTTISITRSPRLESLLKQLGNLPAVALQAVGAGMARAGQTVLAKAVEQRFTGKGPFPVAQHRLGVRTNLLRKSLRVTPPQINSSTNEVTQGFGSNVRYFLLHELGFTGPAPVRAHTRKTASGKTSQVRAHTRNLTIAARAPMTTELQSERTRKAYLVAINRELELAIDRNGGLA
jgi:hypothetical protein